jgi:hypothetical protein
VTPGTDKWRFGIDFFDTRWQDTDLVDWAANTANYGRRDSGGRLSRIPLVQHLLRTATSSATTWTTSSSCSTPSSTPTRSRP